MRRRSEREYPKNTKQEDAKKRRKMRQQNRRGNEQRKQKIKTEIKQKSEQEIEWLTVSCAGDPTKATPFGISAKFVRKHELQTEAASLNDNFRLSLETK